MNAAAAGLLACGVVMSAAAAEPPPSAQDEAPAVAVLELFTSQGCSSCPPADALLGSLATRADILALTLPVDYWDYLGWKDTLASPVFSTRQRAYAKRRGDHQVYTPQLVVNGAEHVNGSDMAAIEKAIAKTRRALQERRVALKLSLDGDTFTVDVGASPMPATATKGVVWLALVQSRATVKIGRGENRDKELTYHNVVRELVPVGKWYGDAVTLKLPLCRQVRDDIDGCVVLVQQGMAGPVVAAAHHGWR